MPHFCGLFSESKLLKAEKEHLFSKLKRNLIHLNIRLPTPPLNINLAGFFDGNFRYEAKRYGQVDNLYWTGDVALLNGRVGVRSANWEIALYGDNLLDDDTPTGIGRTVDRTQPNFVGGTRRGFSLGLRRGREAGVTARFNF